MQGTGFTCDLISNSFTTKENDEKRIDYIFFNDEYLKCQTCQITMGRIPGVNYNYSDHEGVVATLQLNTRKLRQQRQDVIGVNHYLRDTAIFKLNNTLIIQKSIFI